MGHQINGRYRVGINLRHQHLVMTNETESNAPAMGHRETPGTAYQDKCNIAI